MRLSKEERKSLQQKARIYDRANPIQLIRESNKALHLQKD